MNTSEKAFRGCSADRLLVRKKQGHYVRRKLSTEHRLLVPEAAQCAYLNGGLVKLTMWYKRNRRVSLSEAMKLAEQARGFSAKPMEVLLHFLTNGGM
jgi:hypothetical protein